MKFPRPSVLVLTIAGSFAPGISPSLHAGWQNYEDAEVILGRKTLPSPANVHLPEDVATSASGKVFVVDMGNHRVLRYSSAAALGNGQPAEAAFGQPDLFSAEPHVSQAGLDSPESVAVDSAGNLWVSDTGNNRILRWSNADTAATGAAAAQVLGQPDFTTASGSASVAGFSCPAGIAVDSSGRLWVADYFNNRVLRFENAAAKSNGGNADGVLGQTDFSSNESALTPSGFNSAYDVAADAQGRLWVVDFGNRRVLRFDNAAAKANGGNADGVLGQPDFTSNAGGDGPAQNNRVIDIAVSSTGAFYVADDLNSRILRWDNAAAKANGANADGVLGRLSTASGAEYPATPGAVSSGIRGLFVDAAGRLWSADRNSERVLRWDSAGTKLNGAAADGVIGQPNTATTLYDTVDPAAGVTSAHSGVDDPASGKFFIGDSGRVLRYASRSAAESGAPPEAILGQPDNLTLGSFPSASTLSSTSGMAMDSAGNLWVADVQSNRVVSFPAAASAGTGSAMGVVLGQTDFSSSPSGLAAAKFNQPRGLAIDASNNLYVADSENHRVLRFNNVPAKATGASADAVIGQANFTSASTAVNAALLRNPSGVALDPQGRLWVADTGKDRVARYNAPLSTLPTDAPSGFLGGSKGLDATGMNQPLSVAASAGGRVWVADYGWNRVLRFDNAAAKANSAAADGVLGEPDFNTRLSEARTRHSFNRPEGLFLDATGSLWVADTANFRVLKFLPVTTAAITATGTNGLGQFNLTFHGAAGSSYQLRSSIDLKTWDLEASYPLTDGLPKNFVNTKSGPKRFFRIEEP